MKFLHTADWQLGMKAVHVAEAADQVRNARLTTVERIMELAREEDADLIIVAGDLFEDNHVHRDLVEAVVRCLSASPTDVYIIPGNHDHFGADSIYQSRLFANLPEHVHVLTERKPVELPSLNCVLFPCPVTQKFTMIDPTEWIPEEGYEGRIRIGIAHGSLEGVGSQRGSQGDNPIALGAQQKKRLDYLALGHWHSVRQCSERVFYSGTPEPTAFNERDSGNVLLVEIDGPGVLPRVRSKPTRHLTWLERSTEVHEPYDVAVASLRHDLESIANPERTLLRLHVAGSLSATGYEELHRVADALSGRFLYFELREERLLPEVLTGRLEEFARSHPVTGGVFADLRALLADAEGRGLDADAQMTATSLPELRRIAEESIPPNDEERTLGREEITAALLELARALGEVER